MPSSHDYRRKLKMKILKWRARSRNEDEHRAIMKTQQWNYGARHRSRCRHILFRTINLIVRAFESSSFIVVHVAYRTHRILIVISCCCEFAMKSKSGKFSFVSGQQQQRNASDHEDEDDDARMGVLCVYVCDGLSLWRALSWTWSPCRVSWDDRSCHQHVRCAHTRARAHGDAATPPHHMHRRALPHSNIKAIGMTPDFSSLTLAAWHRPHSAFCAQAYESYICSTVRVYLFVRSIDRRVFADIFFCFIFIIVVIEREEVCVCAQ